MRYPGGKGGSYRRLIALMPPHEVYIETHLGGGAVMRHKRPATRNIGIDIDPAVHARWPSVQYPNVEMVVSDAISYLQKFAFTGRELIYCDPPYLSSTRRRERVYRYDYTESDHLHLLKCLRSLPCAVLLSGYDSDLYNDLLSDWEKVRFSAASQVGARQEVVWLNFEPPQVPYDLRFLGSDFREREQVKRRQMGLRSRIERLSEAERALLGSWLANSFPEAISSWSTGP